MEQSAYNAFTRQKSLVQIQYRPLAICWLLGLLMPLASVGCAAWTSPTPPSPAFDAAATACQVEIMQAAPTSGLSESNQYDAYIACLHDKGW